MKLYLYTISIILISSLYNCDSRKVVNTKNQSFVKDDTIKKYPKKSSTEKPWDSITRENSHAFLSLYGIQNKETKVRITTDFGTIDLRLFNDAPIHRANFIFLTKTGYFNHTVFYRIAKDMAIQGGDSDNVISANIRNKYKNYLLNPEISRKRSHKYGALAAAKKLNDNPKMLSSPFDFYIVYNKSGAHHLDSDYTVFGEVISGFSTIHKIANVKTSDDDWPIEDVHMTIEVIE